MNIYYVELELEDQSIDFEVTAESEEHAEDMAVNEYYGLVRNVVTVELVGAA